MSASRNKALRLLLALVAGLIGCATPAAADVFRVGDYGFYPGEQPGSYDLIASVPEAVANDDAVIWPEGCTQTSRDRQTAGGLARFSYGIRCDRPLARADVVRTPWPVDGGTFVSTATGTRVQSALQPVDDMVTLPIGETVTRIRPLPEIATDYTWQGILHILGGWDHLAFVLCLCLLARGRALLLLVTTFTLGHSLSLALAFFDVVKVPVPPVEAVIALSIAFMAREALRAPRDATVDAGRQRRYLAVVAGFGLLHGLGFATVLRELSVAPDERVSGLVFFNAGVELGQLLFVGCVVSTIWVAHMVGKAQPVRATALYAAGTIGCFWMIERIYGFTAGMA